MAGFSGAAHNGAILAALSNSRRCWFLLPALLGLFGASSCIKHYSFVEYAEDACNGRSLCPTIFLCFVGIFGVACCSFKRGWIFWLRIGGVLRIWKYLGSGDGTLSFPVVAGPRCCLEGQLSPRSGSISPIKSAISLFSWGFRTLQGGFNPGDVRVRCGGT